jgi:Ser-tRNA(Ala) deacylase AlaX
MSKSYDPRMHSAEHILNQTMVRLLNSGRSFSAHIEKKKSKCDYHYTRNLTREEISLIENKVNEVIKADMNISEEFLEREEAERSFSLQRLPEDAGNEIRIIKIGTYDSCPCSGVHVKSTKEIGEFKIISSDFSGDILRVRFKLTEKDDL